MFQVGLPVSTRRRKPLHAARGSGASGNVLPNSPDPGKNHGFHERSASGESSFMSHTHQQYRSTNLPEDDLGSLIFQGKPSIRYGVVFIVVGVPMLLLSLAVLFLDRNPRTPIVAGLSTLITLIFVAIGVVYLIPRVGSVFFFFENGLRHELRGRSRVLKYRDIASLKFLTQRVYYTELYIGTPSRLTIRSVDPREKPFIINQGHFETTGNTEPSDLQRVCFYIAGLMTAKWARQIEQGYDVEWTSNMRIHADGIEVRDGTIIMRDGKLIPNLVPWNKVARAEIVEGYFRLSVEGENRFRVIVKVDAPNFFPGYLYLLKRLPVDVTSLPHDVAQRLNVQSF